MTAIVVPFPIVRRRSFILKQARRAAELNPTAGERHIQNQLKCQEDAMRRKGVDEKLIRRELIFMDAAIRTTLWQVTGDLPGGAA